jgi:predicted metal-dependent peptidase
MIKSIADYSSQSNAWTYTYSRFNRRYFAGGIYAPGRTFQHRQNITVAVDVSGSMVMKPGDIEAAFGVVEDLLAKYSVHLLCMDEQVFIPELKDGRLVPSASHKPYLYRKGDWRFIRTGASGTTFFAPLFNDFMRHHRELLIVVTDGYIYDLERLKPHVPTLWVISEHAPNRSIPRSGR